MTTFGRETDDPTADDLAALTEQAQAGDAAALESLLVAVQDDIHRLALRMTGCPDDARDATQEILIKVMTRLSTFRGQAAVRTWVHRVAVNHLLDRRKSTVERHELTFTAFAADLDAGLAARTPTEPDQDVLAREVKHGCTLALLTCLDRDLRIAYILGEVFEVKSVDGAWICEISETAFRKRLSRARTAIRHFLGEHCGLIAPERARCHCRRRIETAVTLGRVDPARSAAGEAEVTAAVAEMEALYDAAALLRSGPEGRAPGDVTRQIAQLVRSGRSTLTQ